MSTQIGSEQKRYKLIASLFNVFFGFRIGEEMKACKAAINALEKSKYRAFHAGHIINLKLYLESWVDFRNFWILGHGHSIKDPFDLMIKFLEHLDEAIEPLLEYAYLGKEEYIKARKECPDNTIEYIEEMRQMYKDGDYTLDDSDPDHGYEDWFSSVLD